MKLTNKIFLPRSICGAEERGQHAAFKNETETPKNLTSDWLMVTALSSVIGPHLMVREVARRRAM